MIENRLYRCVDFIYKLILLNFAYFFSILIGLGVVGFFPATYTLFKSIALVKEKTAMEIIRYFCRQYQATFLKANIIGYPVLFVCIGAYINYQVLMRSPIFILNVLSIVLLLVVTYLVIMIINGLILLNRCEIQGNIKRVITQSGIYTFVNIGYTLLELILLGIYSVAILRFPVFFLFGGTSLVIYMLTKIFTLGINKIHRQKLII